MYSDEPVLEEISEVADTSSLSSMLGKQKNGSHLHHSFSHNSTAQDSILREVVLELEGEEDEEDNLNDNEKQESTSDTRPMNSHPFVCGGACGTPPNRVTDDDHRRNVMEVRPYFPSSDEIRLDPSRRQNHSHSQSAASPGTATVTSSAAAAAQSRSRAAPPQGWAPQSTRVIFPLSSHSSDQDEISDEDGGVDVAVVSKGTIEWPDKDVKSAHKQQQQQQQQTSEAEYEKGEDGEHIDRGTRGWRKTSVMLAAPSSKGHREAVRRKKEDNDEHTNKIQDSSVSLHRPRDEEEDEHDEMVLVPKFKDLFGHAMKALAKPSSRALLPSSPPAHGEGVSAATVNAPLLQPSRTYAATPRARRQTQRSTPQLHSPPPPSSPTSPCITSAAASAVSPTSSARGVITRRPLVYGWQRRASTEAEKCMEREEGERKEKEREAALRKNEAAEAEGQLLQWRHGGQRATHTPGEPTINIVLPPTPHAQHPTNPSASVAAPNRRRSPLREDISPAHATAVKSCPRQAASRQTQRHASASSLERVRNQTTSSASTGRHGRENQKGCVCFAQVELDPNTLIVVRIRAGDDTADLATRFIQEHRLKPSVYPLLKAHFDQQRAHKMLSPRDRTQAGAKAEGHQDPHRHLAEQHRRSEDSDVAMCGSSTASGGTNENSHSSRGKMSAVANAAAPTSSIGSVQHDKGDQQRHIPPPPPMTTKRAAPQLSPPATAESTAAVHSSVETAAAADVRATRTTLLRAAQRQREAEAALHQAKREAALEQQRRRRGACASRDRLPSTEKPRDAPPPMTSEERELLQHCTFRPHINTHANVTGAAPAVADTSTDVKRARTTPVTVAADKTAVNTPLPCRTERLTRMDHQTPRSHSANTASLTRRRDPSGGRATSSTTPVTRGDAGGSLALRGTAGRQTALRRILQPQSRIDRGTKEETVSDMEADVETGGSGSAYDRQDSRASSYYPIVLVTPAADEGRATRRVVGDGAMATKRSWRDALSAVSSLSVAKLQQQEQLQQQQTCGWSRTGDASSLASLDDYYPHTSLPRSTRSGSSSYTNPFAGR